MNDYTERNKQKQFIETTDIPLTSKQDTDKLSNLSKEDPALVLSGISNYSNHQTYDSNSLKIEYAKRDELEDRNQRAEQGIINKSVSNRKHRQKIDNKEKEKVQRISLVEFASEAIMSKYRFLTIEESKDTYYYKDGVYVPGGEVLIEKEAEMMYRYKLANRHLSEIKGHIMREHLLHS